MASSWRWSLVPTAVVKVIKSYVGKNGLTISCSSIVLFKFEFEFFSSSFQVLFEFFSSSFWVLFEFFSSSFRILFKFFSKSFQVIFKFFSSSQLYCPLPLLAMIHWTRVVDCMKTYIQFALLVFKDHCKNNCLKLDCNWVRKRQWQEIFWQS